MSWHCTPLRYPGGKQRLTPFIREILVANSLTQGDYVEPYAGGAGVALQLLLEGSVNHIHLNDSCFPIYAFWNSVMNRPEDICRRITDTPLTVEEWKKHRKVLQNPTEHSETDVGFSTFYLNRCNRSGVLNGGLIGGLAQTGDWKMDARFPRSELVRRIKRIASHSESITLRNWDAKTFITDYISTLPADTLVYCDPPYFAKANRLYLNHYKESDHSSVARVIQKQMSRKWVVSYDNAPEVLGYYKDRRSFVYSVHYNASRAYTGKEIFIFSDDLMIPEHSCLPNVEDALSTLQRVIC